MALDGGTIEPWCKPYLTAISSVSLSEKDTILRKAMSKVAMLQYKRTYNKKWRASHLEHSRTYHREYYRSWIAAKFGVIRPQITNCFICGKEIMEHSLFLDHNHLTGKFRGWLCGRCNSCLGWFEARPKIILEYVLK